MSITLDELFIELGNNKQGKGTHGKNNKRSSAKHRRDVKNLLPNLTSATTSYNTSQREYRICKICNEMIYFNRISAHIRDNHPDKYELKTVPVYTYFRMALA